MKLVFIGPTHRSAPTRNPSDIKPITQASRDTLRGAAVLCAKPDTGAQPREAVHGCRAKPCQASREAFRRAAALLHQYTKDTIPSSEPRHPPWSGGLSCKARLRHSTPRSGARVQGEALPITEASRDTLRGAAVFPARPNSGTQLREAVRGAGVLPLQPLSQDV